MMDRMVERVAGRVVALLVVALACAAGLARPATAQEDEEEAAPGGEDAEPMEEGSDAPPGQVSVAASTSVVVDEREADLAREQAEMREEAGSEARPRPTDHPDSLDHELQVGLRFGAGVPFLFALRYGTNGTPCDEGGNPFCVLVGSGVMDLDLSFGVLPDLEITLMGRYGMAGVEPTASNNIVLGLGIRSYIGPESIFKGFFGVRAILDLTPAGMVSGWSDVDAGVRGEAGIQVDFVRYFGLYLQIGVNITVVRALAIAPDATGGLQLRVP